MHDGDRAGRKAAGPRRRVCAQRTEIAIAGTATVGAPDATDERARMRVMQDLPAEANRAPTGADSDVTAAALQSPAVSLEPPTPPRPPITMRERARVEVTVMGVLFCLPQLLAGWYGLTHRVDIAKMQLDPARNPLLFALLAFRAVVPATIGLYLLWRDRRLGAAGCGRPQPLRLLWQSVIVTLGLFVTLLLGGILLVLASRYGLTPPRRQTLPTRTLTLSTAFGAFSVAAIAGFGEELTFRAYFVTRFRDAGWRRAALVIPLLCWVAGHGYQRVGILVILALGVVLQSAYLTLRSVWPVAVAHTTYDFILLFPW